MRATDLREHAMEDNQVKDLREGWRVGERVGEREGRGERREGGREGLP